MAGEPNPHAPITAGRLFPWLRLLPAVAAAADPKRLVLAALGLVLLHLGWEGLGRLFPHSGAITPPVPSATVAMDMGGWRASSLTPRLLQPPAPAFPEDRASIAADLRSAPWRLTEPVRYLVGPFLGTFSVRSDGWTFLHALSTALWGVVVWSPLGGAIARVAVVQAARAERVGLPEALRFAVRKAVPLLAAPLSPMVGVAFFAALCAAFGLLYRIPAPVGPTVAGALAPLPLLAGLTMALILLGLAAGWPLMPVAVAAEAEDGFDALSRSYAYVHQRPGPYAAYALLAWGLGIVGLILVDLFARVVVGLAEWGLSFAAPGDLLAMLFGSAPPHRGADPDPTAAALHTFWLSAVGLLAHAWIYSYFWTSAATIYLLLRRDVDGTAWHDIALADRAAPAPAPSPSPESGAHASTA
ncbi:MAG TPA: hypothetical protein VKP69_01700 [Isosphaeraceae bacterium]|nr:hypothetical protein [Isosphaeraceae bacterium]